MEDSRLFKRKTTITEKFNNDKDKEDLFQKIRELLIAAGYFRARIQNLDPFDTILGGITWILTGCFYEVDFEFKDEMSLGEKVRISEKITKALKQVDCPVQINPIQIQGFDLPPIYNLLKWLVNKLHESRDERGNVNKDVAVNYFNVHKKKIEEKSNNVNTDNNTNNSSNVNSNPLYTKAKYNYLIEGRKLRTLSTKNNELKYNEELRIYFNLVEYGMNKDLSFQKALIELLKKKNLIESNKENNKNNITNTNNTNNTNKINPNTNNNTKDNNLQVSESEQKQLNALLSTKETEAPTNFLKLNTEIIQDIFNENIDDVVAEIDNFENQKSDESIDKIKLIVKEKERLQNSKENIILQIASYENELKTLDEEVDYYSKEVNQSKQDTNKIEQDLKQNQTNLEALINKIKTIEVSEEKVIEITDKINNKEELKENISKLKKDCKEEKIQLEQQLQNLEKKQGKLESEENQKVFEEIDENYKEEYEKLLEKKQDLFEENKMINLLTRKIQVFPSKLELMQYQKRFQELYDQINLISEKSKALLSEINSKEEVKKLLNQKLQTFNQLKDLYKSLNSKKEKEGFKVSLSSVISSVEEMKQKSTDRLNQLKKQIEADKALLVQKQEYETQYMKLVKEYNREYNKLNKLHR